MTKVDMVTLQVLLNALHSITDEMNLALIRTAYSTNIKDRRDCSCASALVGRMYLTSENQPKMPKIVEIL